ncbi:MAG: hypothetical protein HYR64_09775 [Fimbriimonas ginsengisoli]|uniref:DUF4190 domain-containing protein n=1 Tax=Fimbriimonas ginsengisoli TaxID=1005039 RepID=A0A931PWJ0_FIMGI|nr:hypothetical protein [Fimbriimonas ginsengisoli]
MRYYVLDPQGNRYGPADLPLLNLWVREGRIVPTTMLVSEATGQQISASQVPGLALHVAPGVTGHRPGALAQYGPPSGQMIQPGAFPQPGMMPGGSDITYSYWCSAISLLACLCLPLFGLIPAIAAYVFAHKAGVQGHPSAGTAKTFAVVGVVLNVLSAFAAAGLMKSLIGGLGGG